MDSLLYGLGDGDLQSSPLAKPRDLNATITLQLVVPPTKLTQIGRYHQLQSVSTTLVHMCVCFYEMPITARMTNTLILNQGWPIRLGFRVKGLRRAPSRSG
eukprot:1186518-Prorocentrum_minimum.AAC.1